MGIGTEKLPHLRADRAKLLTLTCQQPGLERYLGVTMLIVPCDRPGMVPHASRWLLGVYRIDTENLPENLPPQYGVIALKPVRLAKTLDAHAAQEPVGAARSSRGTEPEGDP